MSICRHSAPLILAAVAAASASAAEERSIGPRPAALTAQECERRTRDRPRELESYRCFWTLARQNQADQAERSLQALLRREPGNARARLFLARIGGDRGRDWAEPAYRLALSGLAAAGDAQAEVFAHLGLALFLNRRHRLADHEAEIAAAARVAEQSGDPTLRAWVSNERAALAFQKGDYPTAWRLYKQVEAQVVPQGPLDLQALCLGGLGAVLQETGRIEESIRYLSRQAELNRQAGDSYDEARVRGNLVLCGFRLGMQGRNEPEQIAALAREALSAARAGGNRGSEARAHLYLGDLLGGLEAREHYRRGLAISRETKEAAGLVLGLRGLALSHLEAEPRDPAQAWAFLERAQDAARGSRWYTALVALARARLRWSTGPRAQAIADSLSALDAIEDIRDRQDDGLVRARVFALWAFGYHRLAARLVDAPEPAREDLELAFAVTERMRARVLLDELDAAQATRGLAPQGPVRDQRQAVLGQIGDVQRRLMSGVEPVQRPRLLAELERLELQESALRAELARADGTFAALRQPALATLPALRAAMARDEALLCYQIASRRNLDNRTTERGSWLLVHTRARTRAYPVPDADALRAAVPLFAGLLERRDGSEAAAAGVLFAELLQPALAELPADVQRLTIVPDGLLFGLPFDALPAGPAAAPLGSLYETAVAPSATLWLRWRGAAPPAPEAPVLALADPERPGDPAHDGVPLPPERLGPLPHARREARFSVGLLGGGSVLRAGRDASEQFLKQADLRRFGVLHLATHALVDEAAPERSAILLAPSATEDGLLQIRELVGLDLSGRVVVLSACRSASGTVLEGEGVMGLARGFFQAGARAVVGSLWPLRDDEGERLLGDFYRHLAEGRSLRAALAGARRDRIRAGVPAAAWAGLVVLGDGDLVPFPGGLRRVPAAWLAALAGLLLLASLGAGAWSWAQWRRRGARG